MSTPASVSSTSTIITTTSTSSATISSSTTTSGGTTAATVVVPLYIYPYPSADSVWSTLFQAFTLRPDVTFIVIVNPNSGPGSTEYPDSYYGPAIQELNSYSNVQTIGYVRTNYTNKPVDETLAEVDTYAGWSFESTTLAMHGIFFDEAPYDYDAAAVTYMHSIDAYVKNSTGLLGNKWVVHNPGTVADSAYQGPNTDFTFIFEHDYETWVESQEAVVAALPADRTQYGIMMYAVPEFSSGDMSAFVDSLSNLAQYIFTTSLTVNYYESFSSDWLNFIAQVPS
ncbi:spherulin 4-like cell surface protein [Xylariales sp. PMI_506]|nr:spherulin 4-like cell surface protein [Xylariales sp. PMI_506]